MENESNNPSGDQLPANNKNLNRNRDDQKAIQKSKINIKKFLFIIKICISFFGSLSVFAILYFSFCGLASLTINLFIYDWLSLFTKKTFHFFLSILVNFSNFGLFFNLSLFLAFTIDCLFLFIKYSIDKFLYDLKKIKKRKKENTLKCFKVNKFLIIDLVFYVFITIYTLTVFIFDAVSVIAVLYELFILILGASYVLRFLLKKIKSKYNPYYISTDEKNLSNEETDLSNNENDLSSDENDSFIEEESISEINELSNEDNRQSYFYINNLDNDITNTVINNNKYIIDYFENNDITSNDIILNLNSINDIEILGFKNNIKCIITKLNLNIFFLNEKFYRINKTIDKINECINQTNELILNMNTNKNKKIKSIELFIDLIGIEINEDSKKLGDLFEIYENMILINNILNNFISFKEIIFTLKNLNNIINCPNNDEYILKLNNFIEKTNKKIEFECQKMIYKINLNIYDIEKAIKVYNSKIIEKKEEKIIITNIYGIFLNIPVCYGMFNNTIEPRKFLKKRIVYNTYRIIICLLISALQLYSILYPYLQDYYSLSQFFIYLIFKVLLLERIFSYNFIDICINWPKMIKTLKKKSYRIVLYIIIVLHIIFLIVIIIIFIIVSKLNIFPKIENALFIENNQEWFKYNNLTINPEGFCMSKARNDGTFMTADFAMMTTLPRLYSINEEGKCYIKPSKRGIFNTTIKYIFGKDYERDGLQIMCKKLAHDLCLVISSDKILNQTLKKFKNKNITLLNNQINISNKDYFKALKYDDLPEKIQFYYDIYKNCKSRNNSNECENEWDIFTQYYWPNLYSDKYVDIPGFERYQININSDMIIQPTFIADNDSLWSGTHYIVGGGYEDPWSFGFLIETVARKYFPTILENFLPMYSFFRNVMADTFVRIDWINNHAFYIDDFLGKEMKSISDLYHQFNFSNQSLFSIGHSISGTAFKSTSLIRNMQGIVFEAADGESNKNMLNEYHLVKSIESKSQINNIYSDGTIITGNDNKCNVNGILPKRYILPSVYDTACLTAISCSSTMKYIPFCRQVLTQNNKDPIIEFNKSFNAYLKHYGFN